MPRATLLHFRASCVLHILMNARWRMNQLLNNPPLGTMQESAADHVDFSLDFAFHYCNHQFTFCLKPFIHQCVYSPYSYFYIALGAEKENLFNNQRFLGWQETVWNGFKDLKMALQPSIKKRDIKVHTATRLTIRHGFMRLWFRDLMNVTEEVTIHRPNVSTLLSSAFIKGDLNNKRSFYTLTN